MFIVTLAGVAWPWILLIGVLCLMAGFAGAYFFIKISFKKAGKDADKIIDEAKKVAQEHKVKVEPHFTVGHIMNIFLDCLPTFLIISSIRLRTLLSSILYPTNTTVFMAISLIIFDHMIESTGSLMKFR